MAATVGGLDHPELDRIRAGAAKSGRVAQLRERGIHPACGERMANEQPAKHQLYHQVSRLSTNLDKEALRSRLRGLKDASPEEVARLEVPTLCIVGEEDVVLPPAAVELLASLIPHARLEEVPRTGHSVYWERPELFNTLVSEFAAEL
jgi:pimeloyl-ACP methyl ester carboxylesterase